MLFNSNKSQSPARERGRRCANRRPAHANFTLGVRCAANHDDNISDEEGAKEDDEEEEHRKDSYDQRAVAARPAHRPEQLVSTWLGLRARVRVRA